MPSLDLRTLLIVTALLFTLTTPILYLCVVVEPALSARGVLGLGFGLGAPGLYLLMFRDILPVFWTALVASAMRRILRPVDLMARHGGEEFCVLLPEAGEAESGAVAERLRQTVEELPLGSGEPGGGLSVSIGLAVLGGQHPGWTDLLRAADQAVYRAKDAGRNRVERAS